MEEMRQQLAEWGKESETFRLSRWEELPDLELYMDQVGMLVDRCLSSVIQGEKHPLLTSSMASNYIKLGLIPTPVKRRHNKEHVALLLAIATLKQVLTIPEIKEGILFRGKTVGIREAYNPFCDEQETAVWMVSQLTQGEPCPKRLDQTTPIEYIAAKAVTLSSAMKPLTRKTIVLEPEYLEEEKTNKKW